MLTMYLLSCDRVQWVADVTVGSASNVKMPPTSDRLSKTVTWKPTSRSSLSEERPAGPVYSGVSRLIMDFTCLRMPTSTNYRDGNVRAVHRL